MDRCLYASANPSMLCWLASSVPCWWPEGSLARLTRGPAFPFQTAVVRHQSHWVHLYQWALLLEPAMPAAIFASFLSACVRLVSLSLSLLAQPKDNCLGSPLRHLLIVLDVGAVS